MPKKPPKKNATKKPKKAPDPKWDGAVAASAEAAPGAVVDTSREPVIRRKFKQKLPCRLDSAVKDAKGDELANVINRRLALLEERREAMAEFKQQITALDERERELAGDVSTRTESREVECIERLTVTNEIEVVRLDTGEVIDRRNADGADLQDAIDFPEPEVEDGAGNVHKPLTDADLDFDGDEPGHDADTEPSPPGEFDVDATAPEFSGEAHPQ
jgi:hypothetical protein